MSNVNIVVKVTNACNLRCTYCYNKDSAYDSPVLPLARFEKFLLLLADRYASIEVIWHGGEPMLAGLDYMTKAMEIEKRVSIEKGVTITNKMQTNGTLIDKKWIAFFKTYDVKPGVSFDGVHNDKYRQSTDKVMAAFRLMKKEGVRFGTLAVVADDEYDLLENYKFFAKEKLATDFSPVFQEGGAKELGGLNAERYAAEMIRLFDYWLYDKEGVNVRLFSSYISMVLGKSCRVCTNSSCIGTFFSIYPNGDVCNCGRASMVAYPFGNVDDAESFEYFLKSTGFRDLLMGAIARREKCKESCDLFPYCCGNCSDQAILEGSLDKAPTFSCACFKAIFTHIRDAIKGVLESKISLDELNPAIRHTIIDSFSIEDDLRRK